MRGENLEETVQKAIRRGTTKRMKKKIKVLRPPPKMRVTQRGTPARTAPRIQLEKDSLPGPSAGRGGLLMVGYWTGEGQLWVMDAGRQRQLSLFVIIRSRLRSIRGIGGLVGSPYVGGLDTAILASAERGGLRGRGRDEGDVTLKLRAVLALFVSHDGRCKLMVLMLERKAPRFRSLSRAAASFSNRVSGYKGGKVVGDVVGDTACGKGVDRFKAGAVSDAGRDHQQNLGGALGPFRGGYGGLRGVVTGWYTKILGF